jgi:hypothetical protein
MRARSSGSTSGGAVTTAGGGAGTADVDVDVDAGDVLVRSQEPMREKKRTQKA